MTRILARTLPRAALAATLLLAACGSNSQSAPSNAPPAPTIAATGGAAEPTLAPAERPVAPETNPVGDIPDSQAFVTYAAAPGGYALEVPEGWARSTDGASVRFVNKLDGLSVSVAPASAAPTAATARDHEAAALTQAGRAVTLGELADVTLPGGQALRVSATANSEPDPVTSKQVRLEQQSYLFFHNGTLATLTLWAPQGADNVDQWQRIAGSFRWK